LSYGQVSNDQSYVPAVYVDKILTGASPLTYPSRAYEVRIDHQSQTAKALGLTIPPVAAAAGDEVISSATAAFLVTLAAASSSRRLPSRRSRRQRSTGSDS